MLTGTSLRTPKRAVSTPTCPSLIRKSSVCRSANRDRNRCLIVDVYRSITSIASSSSSSGPIGPGSIEVGRLLPLGRIDISCQGAKTIGVLIYFCSSKPSLPLPGELYDEKSMTNGVHALYRSIDLKNAAQSSLPQ